LLALTRPPFRYGEKAVEAQGVTKGYFRCTEPGCPARKVITKDVGTAAITTIDYRVRAIVVLHTLGRAAQSVALNDF
jgi:metal-sulfur cluster biosynthetic enzyme